MEWDQREPVHRAVCTVEGRAGEATQAICVSPEDSEWVPDHWLVPLEDGTYF